MQLWINNKETLKAIESNQRLLLARSNLLDLLGAKINRNKYGKDTFNPFLRYKQKGEKQADRWNFSFIFPFKNFPYLFIYFAFKRLCPIYTVQLSSLKISSLSWMILRQEKQLWHNRCILLGKLPSTFFSLQKKLFAMTLMSSIVFHLIP